MAAVNKKSKTAGVKPFQIKNHMWVIVNALIHNLIFDSQTEETLTTGANSFGSKYELLPQFHKKGTRRSLSEYSWLERKPVVLDVDILFIFQAIYQVWMDLRHSSCQWHLHRN